MSPRFRITTRSRSIYSPIPARRCLGQPLLSAWISRVCCQWATDTLRITYTELGGAPVVQDFQIPLFGSVQPPFTLIFSVVSQGLNPQGVPATLTIDLLNSAPDFVNGGGQAVNSQTFTFNVKPVPEPATLSVLFGGLVALGIKVRRRTE